MKSRVAVCFLAPKNRPSVTIQRTGLELGGRGSRVLPAGAHVPRPLQGEGCEVPSGNLAVLLLLVSFCRPVTRTPVGERALKPRSVIVGK